jgi:hypothetical protein
MATAEKTWRGEELSVVKSELPEKRNVDGLLEFAEKSQERCERVQQRIRRLQTLQIGILATGVIGSEWIRTSGIIRSGIYIIMFIAIVLWLEIVRQQQKKRLNAEKLVLEEMVNLIREVEPLVSQKEGWSLLERAEFRIRLSRFGIGTQTLL